MLWNNNVNYFFNIFEIHKYLLMKYEWKIRLIHILWCSNTTCTVKSWKTPNFAYGFLNKFKDYVNQNMNNDQNKYVHMIHHSIWRVLVKWFHGNSPWKSLSKKRSLLGDSWACFQNWARVASNIESLRKPISAF